MITKTQVDNLSKLLAIDNFTIEREYLQLVFLNYLYQQREARAIYFKGGTAIRLLFGSPRFSEDLDFSTKYSKDEIRKIIKNTEKLICQEIKKLKISPLYSGRDTERFRIKYQAVGFKYPLTIRLDFHRVKKTGETAVSPLETTFPIVIFPLISHLAPEEILKEKIQALMSRCKGRDFFDVWYLFEKGIPFEKKIDRKEILKKINQYPLKKLRRDLSSFLPKPQREIIKTLKSRLIEKLATRVK